MHDIQPVLDFLQQTLHAGADVVLIALARVWWRLERRIYRIELHIFPELKDKL